MELRSAAREKSVVVDSARIDRDPQRRCAGSVTADRWEVSSIDQCEARRQPITGYGLEANAEYPESSWPSGPDSVRIKENRRWRGHLSDRIPPDAGEGNSAYCPKSGSS